MPRSPDLPSPVHHRALFLVLVALATAAAFAQPGKFDLPVDRPALGQADQADGAKVLADFRRAGIAGDYWLAFELRVLPRHGAERVVTGTMTGTRGPTGPISRLHVAGQRWLIASGPQPAAWFTAGGPVQELAEADGARAIAETGVSVFELQMPFLYWTDYTYEGQARVRGRPTHSFVLRPPAGAPVPVPGLTGVRVLIDAQFQALVKADELGADGASLRTITLLDLKKVGEQWIVKAVDVRDSRSRDKTRFSITGAALDLHWPAELFAPGNLKAETPPVPADRIARF